MARNKDQLLAELAEHGIDPANLPQDGQDGPSVPTLEEALKAVTVEVAVSIDLFLIQASGEGDATLNVPAAGLLAAKPDLRDAELKPTQWRAELGKYADSERH